MLFYKKYVKINSNLKINLKNMSNTEKLTRYESAEALARDVESKWKLELAQRIRDIEKSSIEQKTANWLEALKSWLNKEEETQLREAIDDADTKLEFNEWMQAEERIKLEWKKQAEEILWKDKTWMFSKIENLFSRFELAWQKASESFSSWNFLASIWIFFWVLKWEINTQENSSTIEKIPELDLKVPLHAEYLSWIKWLYLFSWREKRIESDNLLISEKIYKRSFSDLSKELKNPEWIAKRLWFNSISDNQVIVSLEILMKSENIINKSLNSQDPNWKEKDLISVIAQLNKKWIWTLNNIHEGLEKWTWKIEDILWSIQSKLSIQKSDNGEIEIWWLELRKDLIEGSDKSFISNIFFSWKNSHTTSLENLKEIYLNENDNPKNLELLENLFNFRTKLIESVKWIVKSENQSEISNFFQKDWINLNELFEMYLLTWWNPDIKSLNPTLQTLTILKILSIFNKDKDNWTAWILLNSIQETINTPEFQLSEETKESLKNILSKISESFIRNTKWFVFNLWETLTMEQKLFVWVSMAWVVYVWTKLSYTRWMAMWATWTATIAWISWLYLYLSKQDNVKQFFNKNWITSEEIFTKKFQDDIQKGE